MATLAAASAATALASSAVSAVGSIAGGQATAAEAQATGQAQAQLVLQRAKAEKIAAEFQAKQLKAQALEEIAQGQQDMLEKRREKELALSTGQAVGAASGFTTTDPTALKIAEDVAERGTQAEQLSLYGGFSRAAGLRDQAKGLMWSAKSGIQAAKTEAAMYRRSGSMTASAARTGSYFGAGGTILGGLSTAADRYG